MIPVIAPKPLLPDHLRNPAKRLRIAKPDVQRPVEPPILVQHTLYHRCGDYYFTGDVTPATAAVTANAQGGVHNPQQYHASLDEHVHSPLRIAARCEYPCPHGHAWEDGDDGGGGVAGEAGGLRFWKEHLLVYGDGTTFWNGRSYAVYDGLVDVRRAEALQRDVKKVYGLLEPDLLDDEAVVVLPGGGFARVVREAGPVGEVAGSAELLMKVESPESAQLRLLLESEVAADSGHATQVARTPSTAITGTPSTAMAETPTTLMRETPSTARAESMGRSI